MPTDTQPTRPIDVPDWVADATFGPDTGPLADDIHTVTIRLERDDDPYHPADTLLVAANGQPAHMPPSRWDPTHLLCGWAADVLEQHPDATDLEVTVHRPARTNGPGERFTCRICGVIADGCDDCWPHERVCCDHNGTGDDPRLHDDGNDGPLDTSTLRPSDRRTLLPQVAELAGVSKRRAADLLDRNLPGVDPDVAARIRQLAAEMH